MRVIALSPERRTLLDATRVLFATAGPSELKRKLDAISTAYDAVGIV